MYEKAKKAAKKVIPDKILKKNESFIRSLVSSRYKGGNYLCNICGFQMSKFIILENGNKLCPKCGSLPRTRRLYEFLYEEVGINGKSILHFSPSKAMSSRIGGLGPESYTTTDFEGEFEAQEKIDITDINKEDNSYDIVICYHVLEHIENDEKAMSELYRIVKHGGRCLIQTPFKEGETYEDNSIKDPGDRLVHFGQEDHVRIYSVDGLMERLIICGFEVSKRHFTSTKEDSQGLADNEYMLIASKK
jgi:SAM-dependent methyltransferase